MPQPRKSQSTPPFTITALAVEYAERFCVGKTNSPDAPLSTAGHLLNPNFYVLDRCSFWKKCNDTHRKKLTMGVYLYVLPICLTYMFDLYVWHGG